MRRRIPVIGAILFAIAAMTGAAEACTHGNVVGGDALIRPESSFDQKVFDRAILAEVNYHRCRAGLSALKTQPALARVAQTHAKWMARTQTVSHHSTIGGQATVKARIVATGIKIRAGSENIGMVHRYQIDNTSFLIKNGQACAFTTHAGQPIPAHTYGSLARTMVTLWMASSGHRRNILDPKVTMVATAAGFSPGTPYCGQFFVSQDFAG